MLYAVVKAQENCSKKQEDTVPTDHCSSGATQKMDLMLPDEERKGVLCFIVLKEGTCAISAVSFYPCHMNWEHCHCSCLSLSSPGLLFGSKQCRWKRHRTQDPYAMHKHVSCWRRKAQLAICLHFFSHREEGLQMGWGLRHRLQSCLWGQKGTCQRWGTIAVWNSSKVQLLPCIKTEPFLHLEAVFLEKSSVQKPTPVPSPRTPSKSPRHHPLHPEFGLQSAVAALASHILQWHLWYSWQSLGEIRINLTKSSSIHRQEDPMGEPWSGSWCFRWNQAGSTREWHAQGQVLIPCHSWPLGVQSC